MQNGECSTLWPRASWVTNADQPCGGWRPGAREFDVDANQIANFIFDDRIGASAVNNQVADVAASAFYAAIEASKAIGLVPRPTGFRPGVMWLVGQAVQAFWRSSGPQRIFGQLKSTNGIYTPNIPPSM